MAIEKETKYQYWAGICVNIITLSVGAFSGWPSPSFLVLRSDDSPLETGPMSSDDASWVIAILSVGGLLGTVFFAWCSDKIGRRKCLFIVAIPCLLSWIIIPFARNPTHLATSRFLGGFGSGGVFSIIPVYITELSQDNVRGILGTFLMFSCNAGVLVIFVLGNFLSYNVIPWILVSLPIIFMICLWFLPESPQHLAKKQKILKAEKAFRYFRNVRRQSAVLPMELKEELEKLKFNEKEPNGESDNVTWQDFNNYSAKKALLIGIVLMALNQFCGCFAMINYTATIFQQAGSNLSPNLSAIVVAFIQLVGSYVATMLVEKAGRKLLLVLSSIGTGIGLVGLGGYIYLSVLGTNMAGLTWIPVACFSFTIFSACWGVLTLPFLIVSEITPPKIRDMGNMICMLTLWGFTYIVLKYVPLMMEVLGMHGMMFTFASCSFVGAAFIIIFVPETKGKTVEDILALL